MTTAAAAVVRDATADDQAAIVALVRSERLNPNGLHWPRFVVAVSDGALVGAAQMRRHADGSLELGSLVVAPHRRGEGIAPRLVEALLARHGRPVHLVTARPRAPWFARWGFRTVEPRRAPPPVRRNRVLGQFGGGLVSLLRGRLPRRLVILVRP